MAEAKTLRDITGSQATAGASEETLQLSLDGAAAANTIAVTAGTTLVISDWLVSSEAAADFKIQKTTDGVSFFDVIIWRQPSDGTGGVTELGVAVSVQGGANVAIRVRVTTPGGATNVTTTIRSYTEP